MIVLWGNQSKWISFRKGFTYSTLRTDVNRNGVCWPLLKSAFHNSHSFNFYFFPVLPFNIFQIKHFHAVQCWETGFWCLNFACLIFNTVKYIERTWNFKAVEFLSIWKKVGRKGKKLCPLSLWTEFRHNFYHRGNRSTFQGHFRCVGI